MKSITAIIGIGLVLAAPAGASAQASAAQVDQAQLILAREIVESGLPPEGRMDMFGGVMQQVVSQLNNARPAGAGDPKLQNIIARFQQRAIAQGMEVLGRHMDAMMEGMAIGYAEVFTPSELQALHAYVTSPEGHGFMAKSASINSSPAFMQASQGFVNEYLAGLPALQAELVAEIQAEMASREAE